MRKLTVVTVLVVAAAVSIVALAGCPALGVAEPGKVVLTIHNQLNYSIHEISVTVLADACDNASPMGANRLAEPLGAGKSISFSLTPGTYYMYSYSKNDPYGPYIEKHAHQTITESFDWYVTD